MVRISHLILGKFRELGIGAKRTRGYGRFRVVRESLLEEYGAKISSKGTSSKGTLASRYLPLKEEEVEGLEPSVEDPRGIYVAEVKVKADLSFPR